MSFNSDFCNGAMMALEFAAFVVFITGILKAQTQPSRAAWLVLSLVIGVTGASMFAKGAMNAKMASAIVGIFLTTAILWFKGSREPLKPMDKLGIAAAILGMALWALTSEPLTALVISLLVYVLAGYLSFGVIWESPRGDNRITRSLWVCGSLLSLVSVWMFREHTFAQLAQPIVFTVMDLAIGIIGWCRWRGRDH